MCARVHARAMLSEEYHMKWLQICLFVSCVLSVFLYHHK